MQVRGHILLRHLAYARERWGEETATGIFARLSRGLSAGLQESVVPGAWYPLTWMTALQRALIEETDHADAIWEFGHDTAGQYVREMTGTAAHLGGLRSVLEHQPSLLRGVFDTGELEVDLDDDGLGVTLNYSECVGFDRLVWDMLVGGVCGLLDGAGAASVEAEITDGGVAGHAEVRLRWRGRMSIPPRR